MNHFWLDASVIVKRYVPEPGDTLMDVLFLRMPPNRMLCLLEGIGEVISVFIRKRNDGRISPTVSLQALVEFRAEVISNTSFVKVYPTASQIAASWRLIENHSINSIDALILRCAMDKADQLRVENDDLVLVSSDARLLQAAQTEGLLVFNPETDSQPILETLIATS